MRIILPAIAISLVVGFAAASWIVLPEQPIEPVQSSDRSNSAGSFNDLAPVDERLRALEQAVSDERYARQVLQEELWFLSEELLRLSADNMPGPEPTAGPEQAADESFSSRREEYRRRNSLEGRMERLIEAGFLPSQASMIVRRESELQMESLRSRYEAERSGDPVDYWRSRSASSETLRQELGDADYERYLTANDRSTSVTISSVIDSSPAQSAGLQAGDEIVRYDGERVFSMTDLTRQTMDGTAGQHVVVDIMRDGIPMQIVLPRGPVGISGGRRRR
jgi:C-terminal processing protease CtpA/Prc